uniref:Ycf66 family protein n=1 Tax=Cyanothece sp. (strain PCC 7425 / ATCC 29141) TaxID=395961 RepID=B8HPJ2_CYAP4
MVNVGLSPGSILGLVVAVAGAALYFLRSMRPELARDPDIFFSAVGLLCGGILFFQGWRLDPILLFGQLLLTGASIYFAIDNIRLRGVATEQARRNTPIVDEERPVSRVYRAELDELEPVEEDIPPVRRIRSARDTASRARSAYVDELEGEAPSVRRSSSRRPSRSSSGPSSDRSARFNTAAEDRDSRPPKRRSSRSESGYAETDWWEEPADNPPPSDRRSRGSRSGPKERSPEVSSRPRRPRPSSGPDSSKQGDYVDYQPLDYKDYSEPDNSANFDDEP